MRFQRRALCFYLVEMQDRDLSKVLGAPSVFAYAKHALGMRRRTYRDLLAVGRALLELKEIDATFRAGRLSWSKVRDLVKIATPETESKWVAFACEAIWSEWAAEARRAQRGQEPGKRSHGTPDVRVPIRVKLPAVDYALFETARRQLEEARGCAVTDEEVLRELLGTYVSLRDDGTAPGKQRAEEALFHLVVHAQPPEEQGEGDEAAKDAVGLPEGTRYTIATEEGDLPVDAATVAGLDCTSDSVEIDQPTPPKMRREVLARDGYRCSACGGRGMLAAHHIRFRSHGGPTVPSNLTTLCIWCHGLVHANFLLCQGTAPRGLEFRRADGTLLPRFQPGGVPLPGPRIELEVAGGAAAPPTTAASAQVRPPHSSTAGAACGACEHVQLRPQDIPPTLTPEWLTEHADQLTFDPVTCRLRIVPRGEGQGVGCLLGRAG